MEKSTETLRIAGTMEHKQTAPVYQNTTLPIEKHCNKKFLLLKANQNNSATSKESTNYQIRPAGTANKAKKPRRDKSDLGKNFVAPDGGWAWLVCVAAGIANLTMLPCIQQFGLLFRERLSVLGMSNSQITTIINTNNAVWACTGLLNGPMFRRFSFRQVAVFGAVLIFTGIFLTAFCQTFIGYLLTYSILFGFGNGITVSASTLAINTYFNVKRRKAAGFSWTITGLGPIFFPHVVIFLVDIYGVQGTVLIFASISLHILMAGLIYQPVRNHVKTDVTLEKQQQQESNHLCKYCELQQGTQRERSIFGSQYLYRDDDADKPGYEITEPGTPMLSRANDGWFGSKLSLNSNRRFRTISSTNNLESPTRVNPSIREEQNERRLIFRPNYFKLERDENYAHDGSPRPMRCTCAEERALLQKSQIEWNDELNKEEEFLRTNATCWQKIVTFFDLDLLRDVTYVNLVAGLCVINFGELNFSILTPFILLDFGFSLEQITVAMSVLAIVDIIVRFLVPFVTEHISWDNRVFFLIGVVGIALGRTVVACSRSYAVILGSFVWIGIGKGIRTIFWPLILPGYVPLNRLPAASGLQLLISGLFTLAAGPLVGMIRDRYNYSVALHCLNILTFVAATSWTLETIIRRYLRRRKNATNVTS